MKLILIVFNLLFYSSFIIAQSSGDDLADKKTQLNQYLSQAEQLSAQGNYAQAAEVSSKAVDIATQLYDFTYLATALNVHGKALNLSLIHI